MTYIIKTCLNLKWLFTDLPQSVNNYVCLFMCELFKVAALRRFICYVSWFTHSETAWEK